jgi:hypothetical protein
MSAEVALYTQAPAGCSGGCRSVSSIFNEQFISTDLERTVEQRVTIEIGDRHGSSKLKMSSRWRHKRQDIDEPHRLLGCWFVPR